MARRRLRGHSSLLIIAALWCTTGIPTETMAEDPLLSQHCASCHDQGEDSEGGFQLPHLAEETQWSGKEWNKLLRAWQQIQSNAMPPADEPLSDEQRSQLIRWLESQLRRYGEQETHLATTPIRRMNRMQYNHAVRDLLDVPFDIFALPEKMAREYGNYFQPASRKMPDSLRVGCRPLGKSQLIDRRLSGVVPFPQDLRAEHGYDTQADHLSLSPLLMESFLNLGKSIVESPDFGPKTCKSWPTLFSEPEYPPGKEAIDYAGVFRVRLTPFLTRAFRRPLSDEQLNRYVDAALKRLDQGDSFEQAMKFVVAASLASPKFLYLQGSGEVEDAEYALAERLAFFLWGSIPDAELLQLAQQGALSRPETLAAQVDRMLDDPKLKRFCDSFAAQWLQLDRIISSVPDRKKFPSFYFAKYRVSMHMLLEPLLVFETIVVEDRSIFELLDSSFTYRSEMLRQWYATGKQRKGGPPTAIEFKRQPVEDSRQGGVITTAATMTMTSGVLDTKPITRGAWFANVVLNSPPHPPPATVPPLKEIEANTEFRSLRERLTAHREDPSCAGCHDRIDPLGFAFENYGPTGNWRDEDDGGLPIDASGTLFHEHRFQNAVELKSILRDQKHQFARAFAEHLLRFALGRPLQAADWAAIETMVASGKQNDYRMREMLKAAVLSQSFRAPLGNPTPNEQGIAP